MVSPKFRALTLRFFTGRECYKGSDHPFGVAVPEEKPIPGRISAPAMLYLLMKREFLIERRTLGWAGSMGILALQCVVLAGLGFSRETLNDAKLSMSSAALWLIFLFSGSVGMNRAFAQEVDGGALSGLLTLPFERSLLYIAKALSGMIFLAVALVVMLLAAGVFMGLPIAGVWGELSIVFALTSFGYVAVGTLVASMTASRRGRDALLAIALLPLVVPLFLAATGATRKLMQGAELSALQSELTMLGAFGAIYFAIGLISFERVVES